MAASGHLAHGMSTRRSDRHQAFAYCAMSGWGPSFRDRANGASEDRAFPAIVKVSFDRLLFTSVEQRVRRAPLTQRQ